MSIFHIVVDLRDTSKLSKLTESREWQLHSKYINMFKKIQNNDLILFSKQSHYSWDIMLQVEEKKNLVMKSNKANQFREKNKNLSIRFKNKNFLSKYQKSFDASGLSKLRPGIYSLKSTLSVKKSKEIKHENPEKIFSVTKRVKRDRQKVADMKLRYLDKCQICNYSLLLENGKRHSEVHHLRPIGKEGGNDDTDNMIVLCPNHHKAFDFSVLRLDLRGNNVVALDGKEVAKIKFQRNHKLSKENLVYQYYRRHK